MSGQPGDPTIELEAWTGPWPDDDPDANLKADVALTAALDPLHTLRGLSKNTGIPVGALARYVLTRYANSGAAGLLEIGPAMLHKLWEPIEQAEAADTDEARLVAYNQVRQLLSWLMYPLSDDSVYPSQQPE